MAWERICYRVINRLSAEAVTLVLKCFTRTRYSSSLSVAALPAVNLMVKK